MAVRAGGREEAGGKAGQRLQRGSGAQTHRQGWFPLPWESSKNSESSTARCGPQSRAVERQVVGVASNSGECGETLSTLFGVAFWAH